MMLMQRSQVRKCLFNPKTEVYIQKRIGLSDQRTGSRNRGGGGALQVKRLHNILAPKGCL
jgi:hypothetical protein